MTADRDTSDKLGRQEWRIVAPSGDDLIKRTQGHLAIQMMAGALGWEMHEVVQPTETDLTAAEIVATSEELFGDKRYGEFANAFLDWLATGATASITELDDRVLLTFRPSTFWLRSPTFESRLKVKRYATEDKIDQAAVKVLHTMDLPFRYDIHRYPRFRYAGVLPNGQAGGHLLAKAVPASVTKERLQVYLQKELRSGRSYAEHGMHGVLGRALDTLIVASGLKDTVDPEDTAVEGDMVPVREFCDFAERNGVTKGVLRTLKDKFENTMRKQLLHLELASWGEVECGPDTTITHSGRDGFMDLRLPSVSVKTLAAVDGSYTRITPELQNVLDAYKTKN